MDVQTPTFDTDADVVGPESPDNFQKVSHAEVVEQLPAEQISSPEVPGGRVHSSQHSHAGRNLTREEVFRQVSTNAPNNEYGLPVFIYRPDLVPAEILEMNEDERAQILTTATIDVVYDEGYPTFTNGMAFWSQMDFEPGDAYDLFRAYLEMGTTYGARRLEDLFFDLHSGDQTPSVKAAINNGSLRKILKDCFTVYNWTSRCKAYDLFQVAAHHKLRERRIISTTDRHFLEAEKLFTKVMSYFNDTTPDEDGKTWIDKLDPKVAMDMIVKLSTMQRQSLGLSQHNPHTGDDVSKHADVSVVLRQTAAAAQDPGAMASGANDGDLSVLLNDPALAGMAQELIIKVGEGKRNG